MCRESLKSKVTSDGESGNKLEKGDRGGNPSASLCAAREPRMAVLCARAQARSMAGRRGTTVGGLARALGCRSTPHKSAAPPARRRSSNQKIHKGALSRRQD